MCWLLHSQRRGTTDLLFQQAQDKLKSQLQWAADLDEKASVLGGFAAVVVGLVTTQTGLQARCLGVIAVLSLFAAILCALIGYRVAAYESPPNIENLCRKYLDADETLLKRQLLANFVQATAVNRERIMEKAKWCGIAFWALVVGTLCVGLDRVLILAR